MYQQRPFLLALSHIYLNSGIFPQHSNNKVSRLAKIQLFAMNQPPEYQINDERIYYGLIRRVGLEGNYQKNFMRIINLISLLSASTFFIVPYLFYQEDYQCQNYEGDCNKMVCSLPVEQRTQYLSTPLIKSLANYNGDTHCQQNADVTGMQEMFLIGTSVGLVIIVIFIEYMGRKLAVAVSMILTVISILLILISDSKYIKGIGLFVWGGGSQISYSILMSFITEKTAEQSRLSNYISMQIWFIIGCFMNCITFYLFKDWKLVLGCYFLVFYILGTTIFMYYIESTPFDLISRYSCENAFNSFMRIAEINGVTDHGITFAQINSLQVQYRQNQKKKHNFTFNFIDLLRYPSIRSDFLKLSLVFFVIAFQLYGPSFMLDSLKMNIFILGLINVGSQFVTLPFLSQLMTNYPRSKTQTIIIALSTIFSFIVFILAPTDCFSCNAGGKLAITLIFFFASRILINLSSQLFSCSLHQSFPAQIRSIAVYSVIAVGRTATIIIPYLTKIKDHFEVSLMMQFTLICIVGIFAMAILRQTWQILPEEIIKEIGIQHQDWKSKDDDKQ